VNRKAVAATLEELRDFLQSQGGALLAEDSRQSHLKEAQRLLAKAREPGEVLYAGILGGTGVGKSTLINALARAHISAPSDRRPFTDRAVVYRHRDTPRGLPGLEGLIRDPDPVHDVERIRDLVLLDLPDFDSVEPENRRTVERILPSLDAVVWVVSPEKYADALFYELVAATALHRDNFTFVLNKTDELIDEGAAHPYGRLKEVLGDLTFRLKHDVGIQEPRMFSLSAFRECEGFTGEDLPEKEFRRFRDFLMVRRDAKEIASVKTVNLVEETGQLLARVNTEVRPREKAEVIRSITDIPPDRGWQEKLPDLARPRLERELTAAVLSLLAGEDASIGPVKAAIRLLSLGRRSLPKGSGNRLEEALEESAAILGQEKRSQLEKIAAHTDAELLLAFPHSASVRSMDGPDQLVSRAVKAGTALFQHNLEKRRRSLSGSFSRLRRWGQKLVLFLPAVLLAIKLIGHQRAEAWVSDPTFSGALAMLLALLTSLFGAEGLIGLVVFLICEGILIVFLGARRMGKLERDAAKIARSALSGLEDSLDAVCTRIQTQRRDTLERISRNIDRLNKLTSAFGSADPEGSPAGSRLRQQERAS
jgi:hypothetical protein